MKTFLSVLDDYNKTIVIFVCSFAIVLISSSGFLFKNIEQLEVFYLLPLVVISWYGGRTAGFTIVVFIAAMFLLVKIVLLESASLPISDVFYFTSRLAVYFLIALLIIDFRNVHNEEYSLANKDHLTGLLNARSFSIELANEILRSIRYNHIFSLSYLDIDNFKIINDTLGHQEGDRLLQTVSQTLILNLRKTDIIARLGGDEFAIIFPETGQEEVKSAFAKASSELKIKMNAKKWNVSFSVGIVTFESLPKDIKEALKIADKLMYSVKAYKKNDIAFQVWQEKA